MSVSLKFILEKLKKNRNVDCVFLTGSHGVGRQKPYSDLDLVIVLKRNTKNIKSVYTFIDGAFADIFFFDLNDIRRISGSKELSQSSFDSMFLDWLWKGKILFDKSGKVSRLAGKTKRPRIKTPFSEKFNAWQQISYNYLANKRYFESNDPLYHEALEIRLSYSVIQLITGYFNLRGIPWRGEKLAVQRLKTDAPDFYKLFRMYTISPDLTKRFELYIQMVKKVLPRGYKLWDKNLAIALPKGQVKSGIIIKYLTKYWKGLLK